MKIVLWGFPLVVIAAQLLSVEYALTLGAIFFAFGLTERFRVLLLFGLTIFGYLLWFMTAQYISATISNEPLAIVLNRFGLIGYIALFATWARIQPGTRYLQAGSMKETLKAPLIWWGAEERVWRFVLITCALWIVPAFLFGNFFAFMPYALVFAIINPILEGLIWRGFLLGRMVDYIGEKQGLIVSSIAFGLYHLSLGFSIWVCLLFAIGGFYMGGIAIKSKGFLAPTIIHFSVNLALISFGIIF
ncbi:MAG: CPBP family intramembrane metalloprotease [Oscillospiraceae bacterium]|nr:CPBP family intramembrane metalloprotease [Oscillospiraceae bacterium]